MTKHAVRDAGLAALAFLSAAACGTRPAGDMPPDAEDIEARAAARERQARRLPEKVPAQPATGVTGEVPEDLLASIRADAAARAGIDVDSPTVIRAEAVAWPDGSLGCPQPGVVYTQALVPGYWVVLSQGGREYDYRATARGYFRRCDSRNPVNAPPGEWR